jgi:hypothetical protein
MMSEKDVKRFYEWMYKSTAISDSSNVDGEGLDFFRACYLGEIGPEKQEGHHWSRCGLHWPAYSLDDKSLERFRRTYYTDEIRWPESPDYDDDVVLSAIVSGKLERATPSELTDLRFRTDLFCRVVDFKVDPFKALEWFSG